MDDLLQQGIKAYQEGKRDEARKIFITVAKQEPENERAWGWVYRVSGNDKEREYCLKQILRINPKNEKASHLLNELSGIAFPYEQQSTPSTNPPKQVTVEKKLLSEQRTPSTSINDGKKASNNKLIWAIGGGVVIFFLCLVMIGITSLSQKFIINNQATLPTATPLPTVTPIPTATPLPTPTPINGVREYIQEALPLLQDYNDAYKVLGIYIQTYTVNRDSSWTAGYLSAVDDLQRAANRLDRLTPTIEVIKLDELLKLLSAETTNMIGHMNGFYIDGNINEADLAMESMNNITEIFNLMNNELKRLKGDSQ